MIGVSPTYLSKVERDEFAPPAEDKVRAIAQICQRRRDFRPAWRSKNRPKAGGCAGMKRGPIGPLFMPAAKIFPDPMWG
jgi:transcriptional regulator with XRE-family HTH domain